MDEPEDAVRAVVNAIPEAIVILDAADTILHMNGAAERLFAYCTGQMAGERFDLLVGPPSALAGECMGRRGDGSLIPVTVSLSPLGVLRLATIRDTSERKREEAERLALGQQFFQAQKKEALGIMAEWVAHDVGNILNGMLACNEFVRGQLPAGDPAGSILDNAMRAGMRGREVVAHMLAFGRSEQAAAGPVDMVQVVRDSAALLPCSGSNGVRLVIEADNHVPAVLGCAAQLYQVVVNLFVNAVQASSRSGELRVRLEQVSADQVPVGSGRVEQDGDGWRLSLGRPVPGLAVRLTVTDSGCGMAPETLAHIFEPFFTTKTRQGSGLGLSAVLGIITQAGGAISVRTCPGQGSSFAILLPAVSPS